ncbi:MAG: hypothetical protein K2X77_15045 [Candidatus Obscuribacterales bacterium]|jgi:hypothetical protein|nr:hypothetical protein [Candidatus Obscuribacterales bacterium]
MNLKVRLERLCDQKQWARLHFTDGTALTGRMLRLGHDYVEMESYGDDDKPGDRNYSKYLVPLQILKFITVESSAFAEMERRRLGFVAQMEPQESWSNEPVD